MTTAATGLFLVVALLYAPVAGALSSPLVPATSATTPTGKASQIDRHDCGANEKHIPLAVWLSCATPSAPHHRDALLLEGGPVCVMAAIAGMVTDPSPVCLQSSTSMINGLRGPPSA